MLCQKCGKREAVILYVSETDKGNVILELCYICRKLLEEQKCKTQGMIST